jgi:hypothetical protein
MIERLRAVDPESAADAITTDYIEVTVADALEDLRSPGAGDFFGRIDEWYIGRRHIEDDDHDPVGRRHARQPATEQIDGHLLIGALRRQAVRAGEIQHLVAAPAVGVGSLALLDGDSGIVGHLVAGLAKTHLEHPDPLFDSTEISAIHRAVPQEVDTLPEIPHDPRENSGNQDGAKNGRALSPLDPSGTRDLIESGDSEIHIIHDTPPQKWPSSQRESLSEKPEDRVR